MKPATRKEEEEVKLKLEELKIESAWSLVR